MSKCKLCLSVFEKQSDLKEHKCLSYPCEFCSSTHSSKNDLDNHYLSAHRGEKTFKCEACSTTFDTMSYLDMHKCLPCKRKSCLSAYTSENRLNNHYYQAHTGEKTFNCKFCSSAFDTKSDLETHTCLSYKCESCPSTFSTKSDLIKHNKRHNGEKPFKCEFCSSSYFWKCDLNSHRKIHTGEKLFKCDICICAF